MKKKLKKTRSVLYFHNVIRKKNEKKNEQKFFSS